MSEPEALPQIAADMLAIYRARQRMPRDGFARVERRLHTPRIPVRVAAVAAIAAAITITVLAVWDLAGDPLARDASSDRSLADDVVAPAPAEGQAVGSVAPAVPPAIEQPRTPASSPTTRPSRARDDVEAQPAAHSTLRAERELLAQSREALAAGELDRALEIASRHRERFPKGALAPELAAVAAVARCRGPASRGTSELAEFDAAHRGSPLRAVVREACEKQ